RQPPSGVSDKTGADRESAVEHSGQIRHSPGKHRRQHRTIGEFVMTLKRFLLAKTPLLSRGGSGGAGQKDHLLTNTTPAQGATRPQLKQLRRGAFCLILLFFMSLASSAAVRSDVADAAARGDKAAVRSLIEQHADVNVPQPDGATALHWAAYRGDKELVDMLIRAGANAKVANREGSTPLWLACVNGDAAIIGALLNAGADPNEHLPLGRTPVMAAARTGNVDAIKVLVDHGANVNAKETLRGTSPLMWAADEAHPAAVQFLIQHGADINARSNPAARG